MKSALPTAGICIVVMVLFSGFIQPKALISDGWIWFYYLNPVAWALQAVTVNEFKAPKYDFLTCTDPTCTSTQRFGDYVLSSYGNPTAQKSVWYSFAVLIAEYIFLFIITTVGMKYVRLEAAPPPPMRFANEEDNDLTSVRAGAVAVAAVAGISKEADGSKEDLDKIELSLDPVSSSSKKVSLTSATVLSQTATQQLPFEQISMAFKDICYTVTLPSGDDIDLLRNVNGYFEPGTITALMGSSGAGKTTLLDVLAGRKNTGVIKGEMYLNGVLKAEGYFRKIMGYVEQFDSLPV